MFHITGVPLLYLPPRGQCVTGSIPRGLSDGSMVVGLWLSKIRPWAEKEKCREGWSQKRTPLEQSRLPDPIVVQVGASYLKQSADNCGVIR